MSLPELRPYSLLASLLLATSPLIAAWVPPIGIPTPPFGIEESHTQYAGQFFAAGGFIYRDAGNGPYTHYVDNSPSCNDTHNGGYGSPSAPLCRIPVDLPAGSVVEVHGDTYTYGNFEGGKLKFSGNGTSALPIFIRGVSLAARPLFRDRETHVAGAYLILENLDFYNVHMVIADRLGSGGTVQTASHISFRHSRMTGDGQVDGGAAIGIGGRADVGWADNIVIYNMEISAYGDWLATAENDVMGVTAGTYCEDIWIVDSHIYHLGGDSVRTGTNPSGGITTDNTARRVYIGRNHMHGNHENAIDIKVSRDIIVSQNRMHGFTPTTSSAGEAVASHYDPLNIWIIANEIYDCAIGAISTATSEFYVIGNVFYNISEAAIRTRGTPHSYIIGNTIFRAAIGVHSQNGNTYGHMINNIVAERTGSDHIYYENSATAAASEMRHNLFYQTGAPTRINWGGNVYTVPTFISTFSPNNGQGLVGVDPALFNAANNDFHLTLGSPAIDAGQGSGTVATVFNLYQSLYGPSLALDFGAIPRPQGLQWDIGAYEFQSGASPPSTNRCDVNGSGGQVNVTDVQLCANQAIGLSICSAGDINQNGTCDVVDVQRVVNAALGGSCITQ